ncbi:hypothetical protein [Flavobacterium sp. FlaQc-48]|uniref:hypothetical protein n=1 Tax=Flavobacterium sp. FlaQc-48 TaxID=3374181 RepID=UPI003756E180
MKKYRILVLLLWSPCVSSYCQCGYKIEKPNNKSEYIVPPAIKKLACGSGNLKHKYEDFTVTIGQLSDNYYHCVDRIENAIVAHSKRKAGCDGQLADIHTSDISITINIHFHKIYENGNPAGQAYQLAMELLTKIDRDPNKKEWAKSITQNIVEKVFEVIPVPQEASLARFGYFEHDLYSVILLNPKFQLKASLASRTEKKVAGTKHLLMDWDGTSSLSFYRSGKGDIKQLPYLKLDKAKFASNLIGGDIKHLDENSQDVLVAYYNIAGSSDLELSSKITNSPYIALFHPLMKSGNLEEELATNDINACCVTIYDCNPQVVLNDDITSLFSPKKCAAGIPIYPNVGVVGERSEMEVQYTIYKDNSPMSIPFNTNVEQLVNKGLLTYNIEIFRVFNGRLVKLEITESAKKTLLLLPNDRIITQF